MLFAEHIKQIREEKKVLQRQLAAALDIDTPMYSKIERGDRRAKREQVILIAEYLDADKNKMLALWLADKVIETLNADANRITEVFEIVKNSFNKK